MRIYVIGLFRDSLMPIGQLLLLLLVAFQSGIATFRVSLFASQFSLSGQVVC